MGATSRAGTVYPSWAPESTPVFYAGRVFVRLLFYVYCFVYHYSNTLISKIISPFGLPYNNVLFIYVIYVTNHQNHCKCKMKMSVILCSHGLLDWFNKTILFCSVKCTFIAICYTKGDNSMLNIIFHIAPFLHNTYFFCKRYI
jgi:hypothetical protein